MKCKELKQIILDTIDRHDLRDTLKDYAQNVRTTHNYKDFETYYGWLIIRTLFHPNKIAEWYTTYDCDDTHITTIIKQVLKEIL